VLFITAVVLIIPIAVYARFKEIRQTLNGKLCIALLITQLYVVFVMPLNDFDDFLEYFILTIIVFFAGAFSSMFVVNLMCFDIYLTFKHFREPHYQSTYFKKFACFLLIFFLVVTLLTYCFSPAWMRLDEIESLFVVAALITFFLTCVMNLFALISSFYYLIALTRSTTVSENTRFDVERER
jgi:hypothetical protein